MENNIINRNNYSALFRDINFTKELDNYIVRKLCVNQGASGRVNVYFNNKRIY